jgi:hypothetical protein
MIAGTLAITALKQTDADATRVPAGRMLRTSDLFR